MRTSSSASTSTVQARARRAASRTPAKSAAHPDLYIEYGYEVEHAHCILAAMRDRLIGSYTWRHYTGFTDDTYLVKILDAAGHVEWLSYGWSDDGWQCSWSTGVSRLYEPQFYADCMARSESEEQAFCLRDLGMAVDEQAAGCPGG